LIVGPQPRITSSLTRLVKMVRTITLSDGKKIPALGWGNGTGGINSRPQTAIDMGAVALKAGILHIDTAQSYGTESETGKAIQAAGIPREDVWVTTKISGAGGLKTTHADIKRVVDGSIAKLGFIPDLILIHSPFVPEPGKIGEFWQILEGLVEDGTLKGSSLGVSNFRPQDLEAVLKVAKIKPVVNQLEYHPYLLAHLEPVTALHEKYGIVAQSYGPLTPLLRHPTGGPVKPILVKIAERISKESGKDVDAAAVLLLWTIQKGVVAVTASKNPNNIKKLAEIEQIPDLTAQDIKDIDEAGRKVHFRHYGHMNTDFPDPNLPSDA